ncbi:MAG: hypothetical protein K2O88_04495 [Paramuribaculum sp.]|nr:hypothetical protein [Paramuribaculum sp.]
MTAKDNIIPVSATAAMHCEERLFPQLEESSEISVACFRADYSASRIARAVEDVDAHLLNLNVTSVITDYGEVVVDLRINRTSAVSVARSLERYGYRVMDIRDSALSETDSLSQRVGELLLHINM